MIADGKRRADAQLSGSLRRQVELQLAGLFAQRLRLRPERAPEFAQSQTSTDALEQPHVELTLQIEQRTTHRRLRHRQRARGATHALYPGDGREHLQLAEGVAHIGNSD